MNNYTIKDLSESKDRYKLFAFISDNEQVEKLKYIESLGLTTINIGKEVALYINSLSNYKYLSIDVYDFVKNHLEEKKCKIGKLGNEVVAIYNLGILLEPLLELKVTQLLREISKSIALLIIWENNLITETKLCWPNQNNQFDIDFSDSNLLKLIHAI